MKKVYQLFFAILLFNSSKGQWATTVNSPTLLSPSVSGNITYSLLQQKFNLPTTDGSAGKLAFLSSDVNYADGIGLIYGTNIASPIIWMYNYNDRNAFTIAAKNYSSGESVISDNLNPLFQVRANGYVGIGTTNPKAHLQIGITSRLSTVFNNTYLSRGWYHDGANKTDDAYPSMIGAQNNGILFFADANVSTGVEYTPTVRMMIRNDGNVGIGTSDPKYKLAVYGTIGATKVKVTQDNWPDYVFDKQYLLPSLEEVDEFVKKNKHLPGVPSAGEIQSGGLNLGDTQAILLKKIEELTLYVIELKKENERLNHRMTDLEKRQ
jgi:hypothetical protein